MVSIGIRYFRETYGERNRIERWFRTFKERTMRFYNNIVEEIVQEWKEEYYVVDSTPG